MADVTVDNHHSGLIDTQSDVTHHFDPLTTNSTSAVTIETPSPLVTTATVTSAVSLEPIVSDACVRIELAPLPPTEVCQPYRSRLAFTVLGFELFAWETSGESQVLIPGGRRRVALPGASRAAAPSHRATPPRHVGPGLRVRIGG